MPMMLDSSLPVDMNDVEDLFGDDVPLSMPIRTQSVHLRQRLDELRTRSCCQCDSIPFPRMRKHVMS